MSGGSFNYLCDQPNSGYPINLADLEKMAKRLDETAPWSTAARDTAYLLRILRTLPGPLLREVWHDIEWIASGDYGPGDADDAIDAYERATHPQCPRHPHRTQRSHDVDGEPLDEFYCGDLSCSWLGSGKYLP